MIILVERSLKHYSWKMFFLATYSEGATLVLRIWIHYWSLMSLLERLKNLLKERKKQNTFYAQGDISLHKRHDFCSKESQWFKNCTKNHNDSKVVYKCSLKSDRIYLVLEIFIRLLTDKIWICCILGVICL